MSKQAIQALRQEASNFSNIGGAAPQQAVAPNKSNIYGGETNGRVISNQARSYASGGVPRLGTGVQQFTIELVADNEAGTAAVNLVKLFDALGDTTALPDGVTITNPNGYNRFRKALSSSAYAIGAIRVNIPNQEYKKDTWQSGEQGFEEYDTKSAPLPLARFADPTYNDNTIIDIENKDGSAVMVLNQYSFLSLPLRKNTRLSMTFEIQSRVEIANALYGESVVESV